MEEPFGLKERTALYPAKSENSDSDTVAGLIDRARCSLSLGRYRPRYDHQASHVTLAFRPLTRTGSLISHPILFLLGRRRTMCQWEQTLCLSQLSAFSHRTIVFPYGSRHVFSVFSQCHAPGFDGNTNPLLCPTGMSAELFTISHHAMLGDLIDIPAHRILP